MAWVRFFERFIFTPPEDRRISIAYPAGHVGPVRKACADQAIAQGKAKTVKAPPRTEPPPWEPGT